jgi:hypothetical protein
VWQLSWRPEPGVIHHRRLLRLFVFRSERITIKLALVIKTSSPLASSASLATTELQCKQPWQVNKSTSTSSLDPASNTTLNLAVLSSSHVVPATSEGPALERMLIFITRSTTDTSVQCRQRKAFKFPSVISNQNVWKTCYVALHIYALKLAAFRHFIILTGLSTSQFTGNKTLNTRPRVIL